MAFPETGSRSAKTATEAMRRDTVINLRMPRRVRELIDNAAMLSGKTRTDFIVESARAKAAEMLLDRRLFALGGKQYAAFSKALNAPPAANGKLKTLMAAKAPWD